MLEYLSALSSSTFSETELQVGILYVSGGTVVDAIAWNIDRRLLVVAMVTYSVWTEEESQREVGNLKFSSKRVSIVPVMTMPQDCPQ